MEHLLFLSTSFPTPWEPHKGQHNANLVAAIRSLGCRVSVIAPVPWTARMRAPRSAIVSGADYPVYWYVPGALRTHYHQMLGWSLRTALKKVTARAPAPDAVLAFWTDPDGTVAVKYARRLGVRVSVIAGGSDVMILASDRARRARIANTLSSADHVFGVGSEIVRRVIGFGVDPARVSLFARGVNRALFRPGDRLQARRHLGLPENGPLLLWVGTMNKVKAAERVIFAARELASSIPDLRVAMVGTGPRETTLKALAAQSGALAERIIFPGPIASENLPPWYHAANVMVLPSRSEGVPNVLVEGMATGLPFVASRVGSIEDLLPFGPSRVVPEGDLEALHQAIGEVLAAGSGVELAPGRYDILDGARDVLRHLQLDRA
jgi:glycosyltransferase involved in cell wall biosynthesis